MKFRRASLITKIVILAIILYAGISLVSLKVQISDARVKRDELQSEVDSVLQTNTELQYAINHSTDPETIEDIARNKLGLVKPGEKIFYDVSN
ncbi:MAG: septum formation initiator family protein [Clostridiales bacterium]|mgnify:CR=1 FL=1|nr:septum formation initiator family protein [Clostridiales bacterium]